MVWGELSIGSGSSHELIRRKRWTS